LALLACAATGTCAADAQGWHGRLPPADVGGAIDLLDQRGERFTLRRLAGKPALLFFGFTHCSSTCPLALATARQVLQLTGAAAEAAVVFVTLDPLNDGPEQLRSFLARIDARLIGLTGTPHQIDAAAENYGVGQRQVAGAVEHSSMWYLLDAASRVRRVYVHTTPATELVSDIRRLRALEG
jgi:protein SCO1/2